METDDEPGQAEFSVEIERVSIEQSHYWFRCGSAHEQPSQDTSEFSEDNSSNHELIIFSFYSSTLDLHDD